MTPASAGVTSTRMRQGHGYGDVPERDKASDDKTDALWFPRTMSSSAPWMAAPKQPCVYLLASHPRGTLYVGVTSNLAKRVWEHKHDVVAGFTGRYRVHTLVWYEQHQTIESAIMREKAVKAWKRAWKVELIEQDNPDWQDLYPAIL